MEHEACPDWLDDTARTEWHRRIGELRSGAEHAEELAVHCFVHSLRQRVRDVIELLQESPGEGSFVTRREALLTALFELEERLAGTLRGLSAIVGIDVEEPGTHRLTRILILDEGPSNGSE